MLTDANLVDYTREELGVIDALSLWMCERDQFNRLMWVAPLPPKAIDAGGNYQTKPKKHSWSKTWSLFSFSLHSKRKNPEGNQQVIIEVV